MIFSLQKNLKRSSVWRKKGRRKFLQRLRESTYRKLYELKIKLVSLYCFHTLERCRCPNFTL
jgi:undecaprenyl pyrophosphate synthase